APVSDDEGVLGRDLTAQLRVQHHGPGARVLSLDLRALVQKGAETIAPASRPALAISPHDPVHLQPGTCGLPGGAEQGRYQRPITRLAAGRDPPTFRGLATDGGLRGDTGGAGAVHAVTVGDMEVQFRDSGSRRRPEVSGGGRRP